MPYRVTLPSGRSIVVFFYDGPISQGVAFEGLLDSAEVFVQAAPRRVQRSIRAPVGQHRHRR
jgi:hypothetical protein